MLLAVTNSRSADRSTARTGTASLATLTGGLGAKAERVASLAARGVTLEDVCDSAAGLDAIPALVSALTQHGDDLVTCASACAALRNLVGGRTPLALAAAEGGGIPPLLAALSTHGGDEPLVRAACGAVQNVAFYKQLGPVLKANGAVPRLLAAAAAHGSVKALAAEALKRLGRDERGALVDVSLPGRPSLTSLASAPVRCFQGAPAQGGGGGGGGGAAAATTLGALWAPGADSPRPLVLVFLRRLGCSLCRVYAQDVEALRVELGDSARVVCLSFERFGMGSDEPPVKGGSFAEKGFFKGEMYQVLDQAAVYGPLFGRKTMLDGIGEVLSDKSGKLALANARGVNGNLSGDGLQLGGQFVVFGGLVVLDKRQEFFGDDASPEELRAAVRDALTAPLLSFRAPN
jgi:hypothetical protein